jgi:hypothetical protein
MLGADIKCFWYQQINEAIAMDENTVRETKCVLKTYCTKKKQFFLP